jgi:hypothetical protein
VFVEEIERELWGGGEVAISEDQDLLFGLISSR